MKWTNKLDKELKELRAKGYTGQEIADQLNSKFGLVLTKSAALGRSTRIQAALDRARKAREEEIERKVQNQKYRPYVDSQESARVDHNLIRRYAKRDDITREYKIRVLRNIGVSPNRIARFFGISIDEVHDIANNHVRKKDGIRRKEAEEGI